MKFLTYSLWIAASVETYMDRNFKNTNREPNWPTRSCRKKIGPFEVNLISTASIRKIGDKRIRAADAPSTSITRFVKSDNFFLSLTSKRSGYMVGSTGR